MYTSPSPASPQGVPLFDAITHLGRDIIRERLRHAMELAGPGEQERGRGLDGVVDGRKDRLRLRQDNSDA
jgi:hypothetical protein